MGTWTNQSQWQAWRLCMDRNWRIYYQYWMFNLSIEEADHYWVSNMAPFFKETSQPLGASKQDWLLLSWKDQWFILRIIHILGMVSVSIGTSCWRHIYGDSPVVILHRMERCPPWCIIHVQSLVGSISLVRRVHKSRNQGAEVQGVHFLSALDTDLEFSLPIPTVAISMGLETWFHSGCNSTRAYSERVITL